MTPPASIARYDAARWSGADLIAAKGGRRLSLVIPARNEAATVGSIVAQIRDAFVTRLPLLDEVIVIDSDSTDDTARRAAAAGAQVHAAAGIRPDLGPGRGKGEALWKSQFVTTGDVLIFMDADLLTWGPHFVTGLAGPMLTGEHHLVKAIYDRPMLDDDGVEVERGGRVTELVARPLLALYRPELSDLVQPLAGEWAITREAFAQLHVPRGYGVEIAALLDVCTRYGTSTLAQVDLGKRTHRHHRHDALGPMAVQVAAALARRCTANPSFSDNDVTMRQFRAHSQGYAPQDSIVDIGERPPASTVGPAADDGRSRQ